MKKLFTLLMAAVLVFSFASCGKKEECILLFENEGTTENIDLSYDLTGDGKDDTVNIALTEDYCIEVAMGESKISLGYGEAYYIDKVYAIDLDTKEKGKELVLISEEISSDMMLRILKPEEDTFRLYEFEHTDSYSGEPYTWDTLSVGYEPEISFEGGILKTSKRGRTGMWCVETEYSFDGEKFTEVEMKERKVLRPSYNSEWWPELPEEDAEAMAEGYVIAYADFENYGDALSRDGMTNLNAGDVFKITKEDSDGFVFIEKKSGESGWIYMGDFKDNRYEVSEIAFFLAD